MDGVARIRRVVSVSDATGKQWSGREAAKVRKQSEADVGQGKLKTRVDRAFWTESLRNEVEAET